jgi:hypothetical protein
MASSAMTDASVPPAGPSGPLTQQGRLEAEALFEQAREEEAKKWLPNLTGEMDETDSEPESSE